MQDHLAYSYRADRKVPDWPDDKPLFLFDGRCVLCSTGVRWLMRFDGENKVNIASAQSATGAALYRHYGKQMDDSYLLIADGRAWEKSAGYIKLAAVLGGGWHIFRIFALIPTFLRDSLYDLVARNRYRWFGKSDYCALLDDQQKKHLLDI